LASTQETPAFKKAYIEANNAFKMESDGDELPKKAFKVFLCPKLC